ncbi:hypothetical protein [Amycolatopsis minnesotensis]|uniref:CdiI immunity protein domain-containing protein n=1 Tax=Amycolatopsis minnesotensis TaxID=337894 RepID=A0ABN2Q0A2_9PSEU
MKKDFGDMIPLAPDFAAERFTEVFTNGLLARHLGTYFTCAEVNHIADVLHSNGSAEGAQLWLNAHFWECDEISGHDVYLASVFELPEKSAA